MIEMLYQAGASLDDEDDDGWVPLGFAAHSGWYHAVEKLMNLGADFDKTSWGLTPLEFAVERGYIDIVRLLLVAGARLDSAHGRRLTHGQLAFTRDYNVTANDMTRHTDGKSQSKPSNTLAKNAAEDEIDIADAPLALEWDLPAAATRGALARVERLLEKGCTLKAGKGSPWCPLSIAISRGHWEVASKLVEAGADLDFDHRNPDGTVDMPFMEAASTGNMVLIELMIRHGADVNINDAEGLTQLLRSLDLCW